MAGERFRFGAFILDSGRGTLFEHDAPVAVGSKGVALLQALIEARGQAVAKAVLMDAAWPNTSVEESNLTVQIAQLRKRLGTSPDSEEWIATVPRVGYRFVGAFNVEENGKEAPSSQALPLAPPSKASIAVLPFTNMSSDPEQEFFADGLAEDLISDLSKVPGLLVIARNSSFTYKGKAVDIRSVAKDLGVRYVVEGSVRRVAARVRIGAQLIDTSDHSHLWVDRFDRDLADIFALQDEIVGKIVNALADVLPSGLPVASRRATNLQAYEHFLRGRLLATKSPEGNKEARVLLEKSIKLDPGFAEAHAWLAISHVWGRAYWGEDMETRAPIARGAAQRAVALDPNDAGARWILGYVRAYGGALTEGIDEFETTLRANPNNADAWTFLAELKSHQGKSIEGIRCAENALRLNPYPPGGYYWALGFAQYAAGRYDDAVRTLRHDATHRTGSQRVLAASLAQLGRREEAKVEADQFLAANPHFTIQHWASTQPFKHEADRQHFIDGYIKAGLPM